MSGTQPVVQQYYPTGESQHDLQSNPNFVSEHSIRQEGQVIETSAMNNRFTTGVQDPYEDENDCFRVVRSSRHVSVPCTRNEYRRYKVKVPKQVHEQVPKRVQYTDYETRERKEPYSVKRFETAYREEDQQYTVQVPKKVTKMVKVTKRVPKTVYVNIVTEEPREETIMVSETRKRSVKIPYQKQVLDVKYRTVTDSVPVTKYRTAYETVAKTVYEEQWKTECVPVTNIVHKEIPVYNIVPNEDCGECEQIDSYPTNNNQIGSLVEVLPERTYNDQAKPYVQTYPPYVETHRETASTYQVAPQNEPQLLMNSYPNPVPDKQVAPKYKKPHVKTYPDNVETHRVSTNQVALHNEPQLLTNSYPRPVPGYQVGPKAQPVVNERLASVSTNQFAFQNEPQLFTNSYPRPVPANQVGPKAQPVVNAHLATVSTNQVASEKGQLVMNTYTGAAPTYQVAQQNEFQEVMDIKVTQDPDPATSMKLSTVTGNNEQVENMQSSESAPMKEGTPVQDNAHLASDANDDAPQDEQKVENWIETKYSAPLAYDINNNGLLDPNETENAREEGNLRIQEVVENPEKGGTNKEEHISKPGLPKRGKKIKKSGKKRRRRKRRI